MKQNQSGNVLIFILIAIALLGLLTVTLSRSGDSTNDTGSFEQNQIAASEILSYAKSIENAVQMLLSRGCSENEISFENANVTGYTNPNSPLDKSCHIFDVAGAGMTWQNIDKSKTNNGFTQQWVFSGANCIADVGTGGSGGNCTTGGSLLDDELMMLGSGLKKEICLQINRDVDVSNPSNDAALDTGAAFTKYIGTFSNGAPIGNEFNGVGVLSGKNTACFKRNTDGAYIIYHVLIAR